MNRFLFLPALLNFGAFITALSIDEQADKRAFMFDAIGFTPAY